MLKTFKIGGVHPPENKLSAQGEIITLPLPEQVSIPLSQHIGAPAVPTVKKGDQVKVGQIIGQAAGFISANIHSSVSGTVMSLDPVIDASGYPRPAVTIKVEGDEWDENILKDPINKHPNTFTKEEILAAISAAGIVGMGGATFPTQVKLSPPPGSGRSAPYRGWSPSPPAARRALRCARPTGCRAGNRRSYRGS